MSLTNDVRLTGRIAKVLSTGTTNSGRSAINLVVATTEYWKDKNGQSQKRTEFHRVTFFGAQARHQYMKVGRLITLSGKLRTSQFTKAGSSEVHYSTYIEGERFQLPESQAQVNLREQSKGNVNNVPHYNAGQHSNNQQNGGYQTNMDLDCPPEYVTEEIPY